MSTRNLIPCWTGFRPHFDPMLAIFSEDFGVSWSLLAPILAAGGSPMPLPLGLLGSLGVPKSIHDTMLTYSDPTGSHFGGPGAHVGGLGAPF